jgi:PAS domain S-box-containing protein
VFDLQTPASRKLGVKAFRGLRRGKPIQDLQLELVRKDKSTLTVSLNATPILDASGRLVRSRSTFVDLTDRVRAEHALASSEARLQAILDFSPAVIFLKDLEGRYLLVNREFERVFRMRSRHVKGRTDAELFPRKQAIAYRANDRAVLRTGCPLAFEETAGYRDGEHLNVVVKFPLRDSQGHVSALGGIAIDITARKVAEAALQASEARFRGFVESAPDAVVILDGSGLIQLVNAQTERMFGYKRRELLGQRLERLMSDRSHRRQQAGCRTARPSEPRALPDGVALDVLGQRKDGSEFPIEINLSPRHTGSGTLTCVAIRDITPRKRIEDALRKSKEHYLALFKEAREAHLNLRRLSGLVLHAQEKERKRISRELHDDVGQALTAVSMTLQGVGRNQAAGFTLDRSRLEDACRLLQEAMETVHNFARELRPSALDALGLLPALRSTVHSVEERTGLQIQLRADPVAEQLSSEEKLVLFRVTQESLNNVVKHAGASSVQITVSKTNKGVSLTIADDGRSFDMAREGAASRHRLGLLGMRERVRLVSGEFAVQAQPGKGTTVRVLIPIRRGSLASAPEPSQNATSPKAPGRKRQAQTAQKQTTPA